MPLLIRRNPDGRLDGRITSGPELFLLSRSRRVANRKSFEVRQYMVPSTGTVVFALKNLSMSMLHDPSRAGTTNTFGLNLSRSAGSAKSVYYEGRSFLLFPDIQYSGSCYLVNHEGRCLAGSNIFDTGKLCLGSTIDPLTMNPIDALCFNTANRDLVWQGGALEGAWERNPDPDNPRSRAANQIFHVQNWPTWIPLSQTTPFQIPPQVIAACQD